METQHVISAIIFIVLLIVILITFWLYSNNIKQQFSDIVDNVVNVEEKEHHLDFDRRLEVNSNDFFREDQTTDDIFVLPKKIGGLFQKCPCEKGLICDSGICKSSTGSVCVTSEACSSDHICYMGRCVNKPKTSKEIEKTKYNGEKICLNRHFLKLDQLGFKIESGWWNINQGICLCESDITGYLYVVTENELYRVSSESSGETSIIEQDLKISKMFRFVNKIHVLTNDGLIYQLVSETHSSQWKFRRINQIYEKNLTNVTVDDVFTCNDGSISLRINGKIYMYFIGERDQEWILKKGALKIVYGESSDTYAILYPNKISIQTVKQSTSHHKDPSKTNNSFIIITSTIHGKYKDLIFKSNDIILTVSASDSSILQYKNIKSSDLTNKPRWIQRQLNGTGDHLFKCFDIIWLLTGSICSTR